MDVKFGSVLEAQIGYWCKGVFTTGVDIAVENENMEFGTCEQTKE